MARMSSPNVYQSFYNINVISRVFGVMPLKMMPGDHINGPISRVSKLDYVYSLVLLVMSIVHGILAPVYVLHTIMPRYYKQSIFAVATPASYTNIAEESEISEMVAAMKILSPIVTALSSVCSRLVALAYLHRRFGEFVNVLHNADRLMEATSKWSSSAADAACRTPLQVLDKHLL